MQRRGQLAAVQDILDAAKHLATRAIIGMAIMRQMPVHPWPVNPAAVMGVGRVVAVAVIVQRGQFVTHIDQRYAAKPGNQRVAQQDALHRQIGGIAVALGLRLLQPGQRGE